MPRVRRDREKKGKWWYWNIVSIIRHWGSMEPDGVLQDRINDKAINKALEHTKTMDDGKDRVKGIELYLIKQTHSIKGAAIEVGTSEATMQRWISAFVELVAEYAGYY